MSKRTLTKLNRTYQFDLKGNAHRRPEILPIAEKKKIELPGRNYFEYQAPGQIINPRKMLKRYEQSK